MIDPIDLSIVVAYFLFVLALGFVFRKQVTSVSEYFRGGGKMLWWMSGSSAFMTTFSAWTFTGAAGKAYIDGFPVVVIFLANALGYFICAKFLAAKYRQLRVDTPLEAYQKRYGRFNEQFNLWIDFLGSQLPGGITLGPAVHHRCYWCGSAGHHPVRWGLGGNCLGFYAGYADCCHHLGSGIFGALPDGRDDAHRARLSGRELFCWQWH